MPAAQTLCASDGRADGAQRKISISRERILISRRVAGIAMNIDVPSRAYRGVVLTLDASVCGQSLYRISLWHHDADLVVTLAEASHDCDIVAEWKGWAKFFCLPKFVERDPGRLEGAEATLGALTLGRCERLRRRGATLSKRRPRALLRRKPGSLARLTRVFVGRTPASYE